MKPTRDELMAMSPEEFEAFLERSGIAQRTRDAIAESDARRAGCGRDDDPSQHDVPRRRA